MPDAKRDLEKAAGVISQLMIMLSKHAAIPSNMTRADVNYLRGLLDLLEYLLTPTSGTKIEPPKRFDLMPCEICGSVPISVTVYHFRDKWYCAKHFPLDVTWPIGMHGDDLKAYKERK